MRRCLSIAFAIAVACALAGPPAVAADSSVVPSGAPDLSALRALALNIYHEAQGEGSKGMLAVGWVDLNRAADPGFPRRVDEVVAQGCQFGWVCDDRPDEPADGRAWRRALGVARELLAAEPPADPTRGAMWFHHAAREDPGWGGRITPSTLIGNHLFYAKAARLPRPTAKPRGALVVARR